MPGRAERWLARALGGGDDDVADPGRTVGRPHGHPEPRRVPPRARPTRRRDIAHRRRARPGQRRRRRGAPVRHRRSIRRGSSTTPSAPTAPTCWCGTDPAAVDDAIRFGAHRQAAEMLRRLLDHDEAFAPGDVARMLNQLAYSLYVLNEFEAALEHAEAGGRGRLRGGATARSSSTRCRRCPGPSTGAWAQPRPRGVAAGRRPSSARGRRRRSPRRCPHRPGPRGAATSRPSASSPSPTPDAEAVAEHAVDAGRATRPRRPPEPGAHLPRQQPGWRSATSDGARRSRRRSGAERPATLASRTRCGSVSTPSGSCPSRRAPRRSPPAHRRRPAPGA